MKSKLTQAKELFDTGNLNGCLKIVKTFRLSLTKDDLKVVSRTYEMLTGNHNFYNSLGFDVDTELAKANQILTTVFKL